MKMLIKLVPVIIGKIRPPKFNGRLRPYTLKIKEFISTISLKTLEGCEPLALGPVALLHQQRKMV